MAISELVVDDVPTLRRSQDRAVLDAQDVRRFGSASLRRHRGLWIMEVYGSRAEQAYQQGVLMRDLAGDSPLLHYGQLIDHSIEQSPLVRQFPFLSGLIKTFVRWDNFSSLQSHLISEDRVVVREFARGAQVSERVVTRSILLPDLAQYLLARSFAGLGKMMGAFGGLPALGCSTISRMNPNGETGQILARNLDYEGGGLYDREAMVLYAHSQPPELSFVSFSTLGNPLGIISAHNEAGISVFLHQLMVDRVSRKGRRILSLVDAVIRHSRTLDDAVRLIRKSSHPSTWRIILSSKSENRSLSVEISSRDVHVVDLRQEAAALTNTPIEAMRVDQFASGFHYWQDSRLREQSLWPRHRVTQEVNLQTIVDWIASDECIDLDAQQFWRRYGGGTVGRRNNIQSLVLLPERSKAYVAVPPRSFARPLDGDYVPVPLIDSACFSVESHLGNELFVRKTRVLSESQLSAQALYRQAIPMITKEGRFEAAAVLLEMARQMDPEDDVYPLMGGINLFLVASNQRDRGEVSPILREAQKNFRISRELKPSLYHLSLIELMEGRLELIFGNKASALEHLARVDRRFSKPLSEAAESVLRKGYQPWQVRTLTPDLGNIDITRF